MKKADVERSYHQGHRGDPMVNVKNHLWLPDLFRKYEGNDTHEFSDDTEFWAWLHDAYDNDTHDDEMQSADEWAREHCWELAQEEASNIWPQTTTQYRYRKIGGKFVPDGRGGFVQDAYQEPVVKVYSAGRSGGWCVVTGLPDVDYWDAIALGRWVKFEKYVRLIVDEEYGYQFIWQLHVNIYEPQVLEPRLEAERAAVEADQWINALAGLVGASA